MVSVLMNNYNYADYLENAVESVIGQSYQDWELIVVDDGSNDCSVEIIEKYVKQYPGKVIGVYKENGGQASAMNAGFARVRGEVVAFLDSDDAWMPQKLERVWEAHKEHSYVVHSFETNGPEISRCDRQYLGKSSHLLKTYGYKVLISAPTSSISFTKQLLDKVFPVPEEDYRISADGYITVAALYFSNCFYLDEKLAFYRFHGRNGYYGKEGSYDYAQFYHTVIKNINHRLKKEGLAQVPYRSMELQKEMYRIEAGLELKQGSTYIIYGTGDIGKHVLELVKAAGAAVAAFCNSTKGYSEFEGYPVLLPEELGQVRGQFHQVIIASTFYWQEMQAKLEGIGFRRGEDFIFTTLFADVPVCREDGAE